MVLFICLFAVPLIHLGKRRGAPCVDRHSIAELTQRDKHLFTLMGT